jgi:hypothetical protein
MTHGELLADFYRLARLQPGDAWVVQLLDQRLHGCLARRTEVHWTWTPGATLTLEPDRAAALPENALRALSAWAPGVTLRADCHAAYGLDSLMLNVYRIELADQTPTTTAPQ